MTWPNRIQSYTYTIWPGHSSFPIFPNFLPNPGRILPALTFNGCDPLYVNAGRILPWFGRKLRNIGKLEWPINCLAQCEGSEWWQKSEDKDTSKQWTELSGGKMIEKSFNWMKTFGQRGSQLVRDEALIFLCYQVTAGTPTVWVCSIFIVSASLPCWNNVKFWCCPTFNSFLKAIVNWFLHMTHQIEAKNILKEIRMAL